MARNRERFSSQADPKLMAALRALAKQDGRQFEDALEDAMHNYIEARTPQNVRPTVMAHFQASLEKNRELGKLLAE